MIFTEDAGVWKPLKPYADDGGVFRPVERGWALGADGVWREFYSSKELTTVTLTGGTWVCPPKVRELVSVEGKGGDGGPAYSTPFTVTVCEVDVLHTNNANRSSADTAANLYYNNVDREFPSGSSGTLGWSTSYFKHVDGQNMGYSTRYNEPSISRPGGLTKTGNGWSNPWPNSTRYYNASGFLKHYPPRNGAATLGFGFSFPGGVQVPATPQRYYGIPVTPGQTYSHTIAPGGYLKITFFI